MSSTPAQPHSTAPLSDEDDLISFAPIWSLIRRYRRWLELSFMALLLVGGGFLAAVYVYVPKKVQSSLEFALTFPDVALAMYPNKLPFLPEDLLETSLLREVYDKNRLNVFIPLDEFKSGLSIRRGGADLDLLQKEFRARLEDRKLTLADREKIEVLYSSQLKAIPPTAYQLTFEQTGRSARLVPSALRIKVLEDILRVWSGDAVFQKRVLAFAAQIPGAMALPEKGRDPLIAMMELGERTRALASGLGELARLAGGDQAVLSDGARRVDLQLRLESLQEIRIPQIRSALLGNISDPAQASAIQRVFRTQVRIREDRLRLAKEQLRSYLSTYRDYLSSRPQASASLSPSPREAGAGSATGTQLQFSDTFLTKLMELGKGGDDAQYRDSLITKIRAGRYQVVAQESALKEAQQVVEGIEKRLAEKGKSPATLQNKGKEQTADPADFISSLLKGCKEMNALIADSEKLRTLITQNYMSPQTSLYRITVPVISQLSSALTPRNAGLSLAGFVLVGLGLTLVACWLHDNSSKPQA